MGTAQLQPRRRPTAAGAGAGALLLPSSRLTLCALTAGVAACVWCGSVCEQRAASVIIEGQEDESHCTAVVFSLSLNQRSLSLLSSSSSPLMPGVRIRLTSLECEGATHCCLCDMPARLVSRVNLDISLT